MNFRDYVGAAAALGSVSGNLRTLVWPEDPSCSLLRIFKRSDFCMMDEITETLPGSFTVKQKQINQQLLQV